MVCRPWFVDSWSTLDPLQCIRGFYPPQNPCVRLNITKNIQKWIKFVALGDPVPTTSKCFFGVQEMEYLGHTVSHKGVKVDHRKIKAIKEWKFPTTIKQLRGFFGLIGYYCKFVGNVGNTTCTKEMVTLPNGKTLQGKK